jgi:glycosyltransferase involved in cell wall biosynthesis
MSAGAPRVSVCVPSFNAAPYLRAAIESVLGQSFEDFELVISDDASDDATPEVCAAFTDSRLRVVRSEQRLGQSGNWNRCVELATGEYVILLHADDELAPDYLARAVATLDDNPDLGLVHCAAEHIDTAGRPLVIQSLFDSDTVDRDDVILRHLLLDGCVINPAGVLVRRRVYDEAGPFTDKIVWGVDWHMWIRMALRVPVAFLAEPLARYRQHGQSGTSGVMRSGRNATDETWAANDLFALIERIRPDLLDLKPAVMRGIAHRTWCFAEMMCEQGDMPAARVGLRNAVRIWPRMACEPKVWGLWGASYAGYGWFARAQAGKLTVERRLGRGSSGS